MEEMRVRLREVEKQKERLEFDSEFLKKEVGRLQEQIGQAESMMENKELFGKIRMEEEEKLRKEYRTLLAEFNQLEEQYKRAVRESEEKSGMVHFAHK
jgi:chromosome segregation ATPase